MNSAIIIMCEIYRMPIISLYFTHIHTNKKISPHNAHLFIIMSTVANIIFNGDAKNKR